MHARPLVGSVTITKVAPKCLCHQRSFRKQTDVVLLVCDSWFSQNIVSPGSGVLADSQWGEGWGEGLTHHPQVTQEEREKVEPTTIKGGCLTGRLGWTSGSDSPNSNNAAFHLHTSCLNLRHLPIVPLPLMLHATNLRFGSSPLPPSSM